MNIYNNDVQAMWDSLTQEEKKRLVKQFMDGTEELRNRFREMNKQYIETQKRIDKLIGRYDSIEVDEEI